MLDERGNPVTRWDGETTKPTSRKRPITWWNRAAASCVKGAVQRFGLITTNSITQTFSRKTTEKYLSGSSPVSLVFAIPDHPWVDTISAAAVRIAMTVGLAGETEGTLAVVSSEQGEDVRLHARTGKIAADLTIGPALSNALSLQANANLGFRGITLVGDGFILDANDPLAQSPAARTLVGARVLLGTASSRRVLDMFGLSEAEVREKHPAEYQRLHDRVRPVRIEQKRASYAANWWLFAEPRAEFRRAAKSLDRFLATIETSRHRWFCFVDGASLPEQTLVAIALLDAYHLGVLSGRAHCCWASAIGGRLGVGNDLRYTIARCFDRFPFPTPSEAQAARIRELGEQLDAHRKRQQAQHPTLTITGMYNVLEKLRSGEALNAKDKVLHEQGLVSVLKQIHDDLDRAVFDAYGWPHDLTDEQILEKLVALNAERAEEEKNGLVRWLRPDFQNPSGKQAATQVAMPGTPAEDEAEEKSEPVAAAQSPWPKKLPEQFQAVRELMTRGASAWTAKQLADRFRGVSPKGVAPVLDTLASLGVVVDCGDGRWRAPRAS